MTSTPRGPLPGSAAAQPTVSVVIPTYNRAAKLCESLGSILAQEGVEFEVIVVDDGSTDDTPAALLPYREQVRVIVRPHEGIAAARAAGIAAARGRYVAFHDSDDVALPGRLAVPARLLEEHPEIDLVICNGSIEAGAGTRGRLWVRPRTAQALDGKEIGVWEVYRWSLGQLQTMLFTRRALTAVGAPDPSFRILDDLDLVLRVVMRFRALFCNRVVFTYRPGDGVASDRLRVREEAARLGEKLVATYPEALAAIGPATFRRRQARRYARIAALRAATGDLDGAAEAARKACELSPANLRYRWLAFHLRHRALRA